MKKLSYLPAARRRAAETLQMAQTLPDEAALNVPSFFMPWRDTTPYTAGDRVRCNNQLYRCLQSHTAQAGWTPDAASSLWVCIADPSIEWPNWVQPLGAQDAYALGAKVMHNGQHWISTTAANVWEPGVYGWENRPLP